MTAESLCELQVWMVNGVQLAQRRNLRLSCHHGSVCYNYGVLILGDCADHHFPVVFAALHLYDTAFLARCFRLELCIAITSSITSGKPSDANRDMCRDIATHPDLRQHPTDCAKAQHNDLTVRRPCKRSNSRKPKAPPFYTVGSSGRGNLMDKMSAQLSVSHATALLLHFTVTESQSR
jgi:hypothetical protein